MRLINADDITIKLPATLSGKRLTEVFMMVKESLDKLPTVEAIPIEWLKEWSRLYLEPTKEYTDIIEDIIKDYTEEQNDETNMGHCRG